MNDESLLAGLEIRRIEDGTTLILALRGELDLASTRSLESALSDPLSDGFHRIVVDLTGLAFMDSRGLVTLVQAQNAAQSEQKTFALRRGGPQVQRLFELTSLSQAFTFED